MARPQSARHAMIPYFDASTVQLGPITLHTFGLCVLAGAIFGPVAAMVTAWRLGLRGWPHLLTGGVGLAMALVGGKVLNAVLYEPHMLSRPWDVLGGGFSTYGVLLALWLWALIVAVGWFVVERNRVGHQIDATAMGIATSAAWTSMGCFLVHDHPGDRSSFPLAVQGICRDAPGTTIACHDRGLYDVLASILVGVVVAVGLRAGLRPGVSAGLALAMCGATRLFNRLSGGDLFGSVILLPIYVVTGLGIAAFAHSAWPQILAAYSERRSSSTSTVSP
jgi:phosphatidylglycerol:prolipoprotein diacylglycerol transferase